jgi:ABC-type sugar transport system ATPase subunit
LLTKREAEGTRPASSGDAETPIIEVRSVSKHFGGIDAVVDVSFDLRKDEILALVGGNGAGKSTLMGFLAGTVKPDTGKIFFQGLPVEISSVKKSRELGIEVVFQDLGLVRNMDAAYNMFLGRPITRFGFLVNRRRMEAKTTEILTDIHVSTIRDIRVPVDSLSGGQRQAIAVGRATAWLKRVVILDEPAAALGPEETAQVMRLVKVLREKGSAIIMVTHNMEHVFEVADRVLVMRHGRAVVQRPCRELTPNQLVDLIMLGQQ